MDIHLITVKVSIVSAAIGIMHADRLLFGQNLRKMRHHTRLMQSWLSVNQQDITIAQMSMDNFLAYLKLISDSVSVLLGHALEKDLLATCFVFDHVSSRVHSCAVADELSQTLNVDVSNTFWERELSCHKHWNTDLVSCDIGIWRDDRSTAKVDSFAHHFHSEHAFFTLE